MYKEEQKIIIKRIENELNKLKKDILKEDKESIFNQYNKIYAYNEMANCIKENIRDYIFTGFPENINILEELYKQLLERHIELNQNVLKGFIFGEVAYYARQHELIVDIRENLTKNLEKLFKEYGYDKKFDETETVNHRLSTSFAIRDYLSNRKGRKIIMQYLKEIEDLNSNEFDKYKAAVLQVRIKSFQQLQHI